MISKIKKEINDQLLVIYFIYYPSLYEFIPRTLALVVCQIFTNRLTPYHCEDEFEL